MPTGHVSQARPPSAEELPASHRRHADCPVSFWYVPVEHGAHAVSQLSPAYAPAAQGVHSSVDGWSE